MIELGQLFDAGGAPGGPDVDQPVLIGRVRPQLGDVGGLDLLDGDRRLGPGLVLGVMQRLLLAPLGGATHRLGELHRDRLAGEDGVDGVLRVLQLPGIESAGLAAQRDAVGVEVARDEFQSAAQPLDKQAVEP